MLHLRIVAPPDRSRQALELLKSSPSVCNVVFLEGVAYNPTGDVLLADLAREDASIILGDLKELDLDKVGSIAMEDVDAYLSETADRAVERAKGAPSDAVIWEQVSARTSEQTELSGSFLIFMTLAALIAGAGIYLDSPILIVGAMVVGPEFGPIAGFCVAAVQRKMELAAKSFIALALGLPLAITATWLATLVFKATGIIQDELDVSEGSMEKVISNPDFFAFFVAACAGAAGMLSLSTAKSGALIGVLISVTTIPAAANIGVSAAYGNWDAWQGSVLQLTINVASILAAGTLTLYIQLMLYKRRRIKHLADPSRVAAGLPVGRSLRGTSAMDVRQLRELQAQLDAEEEAAAAAKDD